MDGDGDIYCRMCYIQHVRVVTQLNKILHRKITCFLRLKQCKNNVINAQNYLLLEPAEAIFDIPK